MKKEIYRLGDRLYDYRYGWGDVVEVSKEAEFPIRVEFKESFEVYTYDGREFDCFYPTLSFTEYDFINGGFSQTRPCRFERYEPCIASDDGEEWYPYLHSGDKDNLALHHFKDKWGIIEFNHVLKLDEWKQKYEK